MKLPGEMLLAMQYQAAGLKILGASLSDKIASRLPFCVSIHMDGKGCHFTFMSTELAAGMRRWIVLPKVLWSQPKSITAVISAIAVLMVRVCFPQQSSWVLIFHPLGRGCTLLAFLAHAHRKEIRRATTNFHR